MKITKILVALSFLFAAVTANAGTLTVTGNMEATYQSEQDNVTGNPLGMDKELKFAGSTELDNGITVSVMQDTNDALTFGNSQIAFGNILGLATIYIGSDADPMDGKDDITPSAYEEANGSGSGSYVVTGTTSSDIGVNASQMGIGIKLDVPFLGALDAKYYPKADGAKNADNDGSRDTSSSVGSAYSATLTTPLSGIPVVGGALEGLVLTTGVEQKKTSTIANTEDHYGATAALNYSYGPLSLGYQKKFNSRGQTAASGDVSKYRDDIIGVAYKVNDSLSLSWNRYTSTKQADEAGEVEQETDAINIGYTIGGMTIGFQDASTDNSGYVLNTKNDTRTLGISVAF
jgi:hypothetical protein